MRKTYIGFAAVCALVLFMLSGCGSSTPADDSEYQAKKEACFQIIIDNEELIDGIIEQLDTYDFGMDVHCNDGVIDVNIQVSNTQTPSEDSVLSNDELIESLLILFENEYIDGVVKSKSKNEIDYSYSIFFIDIKRGYGSLAYLADNPEDVPSYDEHIAGNWYYFIGQYE